MIEKGVRERARTVVLASAVSVHDHSDGRRADHRRRIILVGKANHALGERELRDAPTAFA
jgi:hypothetical protein